jgi:shikimate 5-dehydrogenase
MKTERQARLAAVITALRDQARVHVCDLTPARCAALADALEAATNWPSAHAESPTVVRFQRLNDLEQPAPVQGEALVSTAAESAAHAYCEPTLARAVVERARIGLERYGRPLETFNGRDALRDAREEVVDGFQYVTQLLMETDADRRNIEHARRFLAHAWRRLERVG